MRAVARARTPTQRDADRALFASGLRDALDAEHFRAHGWNSALNARAILAFVAHEDVPVIGTLVGPRFGAIGAVRHCHYEMKVTMIRGAGYIQPIQRAYSDSSADLPLLKAAIAPVVVNPKAERVEMFRKVLPAGTPILNWGCVDRAGEPVAS